MSVFFFCVPKLAIFGQICPPRNWATFFLQNPELPFSQFWVFARTPYLSFRFARTPYNSFTFARNPYNSFNFPKNLQLSFFFLALSQLFCSKFQDFIQLRKVFFCWLKYRNIIPLLESVLRWYKYLRSLVKKVVTARQESRKGINRFVPSWTVSFVKTDQKDHQKK